MKPYRKCLTCKQQVAAERFPATTARRCQDCAERAMMPKPRTCFRCGEVKLSDDFVRGGRTCSACRALPWPSLVKRENHERACLRCWEVKAPAAFAWGTGGKQHRRRRAICLDCEAAEKAQRAARAAARAQQSRTWTDEHGVQVRCCSCCEEVKPLEAGFYVDRRKADGSVKYRHYCRECDKARIKGYQQSARHDPERREKLLAWTRAWRERNPEAYREAQKRYRERLMADPERRAAKAEASRMAHRLRRERQGVPLENIRSFRDVAVPSTPGRVLVPAAPIIAAIERAALAENVNVSVICERIGVDQRRLNGWQRGEAEQADLTLADRTMSGLDLLWWEVYPPDEFPEVAAIFEPEAVAA